MAPFMQLNEKMSLNLQLLHISMIAGTALILDLAWIDWRLSA